MTRHTNYQIAIMNNSNLPEGRVSDFGTLCRDLNHINKNSLMLNAN